MTSCSVVRLSTDRNLSNGNAGASPMCEECHGPVGRGPDYREMPARILRNRESPSGIIIDLTWGISGFPEVGQTDRRDNNDTRRSCKETRGLEASSSATEACDRNATAGSRKPRIWPRRAGASLASPPGIEREARAGWLSLAGEDTGERAVAEPGREYRLEWQTTRGTKRDPRLSVMGTAADVDRGRGLQRGLTTELLSMKRSSKTEIALTVANPQRYLRGRGTSVVRPWVDFTRERRWAQTSENHRREQCHAHHEFAQRTAGRVTTHEPLISAFHRVRSELRVCATHVLGSAASITVRP